MATASPAASLNPGLSRRAALAALLATGLLGCAGAGRRPDLRAGTVLVAGGSGRAGKYVLAELRAQGIPCRGTTRSVAEARYRLGAAADGIDWLEADLRQAEDAARVVAGIDYVICVIGSRELSGPNSAEFVDYGAVRHLAGAARAARVRHVALLSAIGVTDPKSPANRLFKGALEWRLKGEDALRASGVAYTIVRPAGLVDRPGGERGLRIAQGDDWRQFAGATLSRADLARVLVECLREPGARNATFEIANDAGVPPADWPAALAALVPDR